MSKPKTTKERGLLDKVLNDIFERELKAYAREPQAKSKVKPDLQTETKPEAETAAEAEADKSIKIAVQMRAKKETVSASSAPTKNTSPIKPFVETPQDYSFDEAAEELPLVKRIFDNGKFEKELDREFAPEISAHTNADADPDTEEVYEYSDWSYETPRPWLSIEEAASMLGRSAKAVERSIAGRWGNHLPEGWTARKVRIDGSSEWRVIPPAGFRIKHTRKAAVNTEESGMHKEPGQAKDFAAGEFAPQDLAQEDLAQEEFAPEELAEKAHQQALKDVIKADLQSELDSLKREKEDLEMAQMSTNSSFNFGFDSLEKIVQSAAQMAQKELASFLGSSPSAPATNSRERSSRAANLPAVVRQSLESEPTTIVIDRSDEVEKLLRELADVQKELAAERKAHLEDMRLINEMQSSMRLLEDNARETRELKEDLVLAQTTLIAHKKQYQEFLELPWWKRLFHK